MTPWDELTALSKLTCPVGGWKPTAISTHIEGLLANGSRTVERTVLGHSFEGRPIEMLQLGSGPKRTLMWSQMHGDEPTHTTVLLNLLSLLTEESDLSDRLLSGLTVGMILPLNPDGAEANRRHNGQGIDVNRDALAFTTPEGQALRDAFAKFEPQYGFNLHNQHHRTATGSPPAPVGASLLVPPIDPQDTQNDVTREATRVAATFYERIREHCGGRVSRYEVDYMARAFGEWSQRQDVSTILVEASGWPGGEFVVIEKTHFAAFVQTLEAIAADGLGEADPNSYLNLPKSSEYPLFDLLLKTSGVAQLPPGGDQGSVTRAELGVDFPNRNAGWHEFRDGVFRSIGDLHENGGVDEIDAPGAVVAPGRIVLSEEAPDAFDQSAADWDALAAAGVTTALVLVDLSAPGLEETLGRVLADPPPMNAALVGHWLQPPDHDNAFFEQLSEAVSSGLAAVLGPLPTQGLEASCRRLGVPVLDPDKTPRLGGELPASLDGWLKETATVATALGWCDRGRIDLDLPADFVLLEGVEGALTADCLRSVFVGGTVIHDSQGPTPHAPGRWLQAGRPALD